MQLIEIYKDEYKVLEELKNHFSEDIATDMMRAVERNGMSAWGKFMVRKVGKDYLLFMLTGEEMSEYAPSLNINKEENVK